MERLDCRGLECPLPVVKTKEFLQTHQAVEVFVDNEIAVDNLKKFAKVRGYQVNHQQVNQHYLVTLIKTGVVVEETPTNNLSDDVVVISSKVMGSDPTLGAILMKSFIFALTKQDQLPKSIIFYNEGIFITSTPSDSLNDLIELEKQGVEIVSCGTCLDFFERKDQLLVGTVTNMYDIVERMEKASKILKP